jgi:iron complex outermembrane recepter protein
MQALPRQNSNLRFSVMGALAALAISGSGLAVAQNAQGPSPTPADQLQEVTVTAEYREEKLQDTPIAITAITSEQIARQGANSLSDILTNAPSVLFRNQSPAFGESVTAYIRGFGQADFDPAFSPGVGLYVDDVYYPSLTGANFDLLDVERVEVLRGPQGTLEGRNSEGGAIRFVTKKPTGDDDGYLEVSYGNRNLLQMRGAAEFKLTDNLFARIAGTFANQDGYVDVYSYGCLYPDSGVPAPTGGVKCLQYKQGDLGYRALRATLRFVPTDKIEAMFSADYIHDSHNNGAEVLLYGQNANPNVATPNGLPLTSQFLCGKWCNYATLGDSAAPFVAGLVPPLQGFPFAAVSGTQLNTLDAYDFSLNFDAAFTDAIKLVSITGYHNYDNTFSADGDDSPAQTQYGNDEISTYFWSEELRLNVDFTKSLHGTVGGYYSNEQTTYYSLQDIRYVAAGLPASACPLPVPTCPIEPLQFIQNDPVQVTSKAAFATLIWNATDALSFTGGIRYSKDYNSYTYYRLNLDGVTVNPFLDPVGAAYGPGYNGPNYKDIPSLGPPTAIVEALDGRKAVFQGNRTDWHAAVDYRFNPEIMAYASAGTGYKAGGDSPRPFNAAQAIPFGPEYVTTYELGIKTDLFDRKVRLNPTIFYNDFKDAQLVLLSCPQYGGPGPCALPQNAGNAHTYGAEIELQALPVAGLELDISGSWQHWDWQCVNPEVVGLPQGPCSSSPDVIALLSPTPLGFSEQQGHAGIQYQFDLTGGGTLTPRFDITYQGYQAGANTAPVPGSPSAIYGQIPGYGLANAHLTWVNSKNNLQATLAATNLFNRYYYYSKFDLTGAGAGTITGSPGAPFGWYLQVKKSFF